MSLLKAKHSKSKSDNTRPLSRPRSGNGHAETSYEMELCDCGRFRYAHERRGICRTCGCQMCAHCLTDHLNCHV